VYRYPLDNPWPTFVRLILRSSQGTEPKFQKYIIDADLPIPPVHLRHTSTKMPLSKLQQALKAQQSQEAYNAARKKSSLNKSAKEESLKRSSKEKRVLKKVRQATRVEPAPGATEKQEGDGDGMVVINDSNRPTIDLDMDQRPKKTKSKKKQGTNPNQLPVVPFTTTDTILLLGEANFSYSLSLINHHSIPSHQMLATSYDTERECYLKYPDGEANVKALREAGVKVEFKVDAGNLEKCKAVGKGRWSRVIFNFPHAGRSHSHSLTP
jgi:25S rRNA (uracil2634-N3)-methyltransferase